VITRIQTDGTMDGGGNSAHVEWLQHRLLASSSPVPAGVLSREIYYKQRVVVKNKSDDTALREQF